MADQWNHYEHTGILPVINIPEAELAVPVAAALRDGGVNSIEVTLRSADSLESIRRIKEQYPDMAVGAGTVLSIQTADAALAASLFHYGEYTVRDVKEYLSGKGIPMRL